MIPDGQQDDVDELGTHRRANAKLQGHQPEDDGVDDSIPLHRRDGQLTPVEMDAFQ